MKHGARIEHGPCDENGCCPFDCAPPARYEGARILDVQVARVFYATRCLQIDDEDVAGKVNLAQPLHDPVNQRLAAVAGFTSDIDASDRDDVVDGDVPSHRAAGHAQRRNFVPLESPTVGLALADHQFAAIARRG